MIQPQPYLTHFTRLRSNAALAPAPAPLHQGTAELGLRIPTSRRLKNRENKDENQEEKLHKLDYSCEKLRWTKKKISPWADFVISHVAARALRYSVGVPTPQINSLDRMYLLRDK